LLNQYRAQKIVRPVFCWLVWAQKARPELQGVYLMLASGGYPWTVVPVERRSEYMQALEAASVKQDIVPFTQFLASLLESKSLAGS
jgi:hypothetical protein